jgi:hypothetical protein
MQGIQPRLDLVTGQLADYLSLLRKKYSQGVLAAYGATAKSCTLLNYVGADNGVLDWVVDTTPWKQGRYTPGTKIQVLAPKDEPARADVYLLTAWNYLPTILRKESMYMSEGGRFLVPLPKPVLP